MHVGNLRLKRFVGRTGDTIALDGGAMWYFQRAHIWMCSEGLEILLPSSKNVRSLPMGCPHTHVSGRQQFSSYEVLAFLPATMRPGPSN